MTGKMISDDGFFMIDFDLGQVAFFDVEIFDGFGWNGNGQAVAGSDNFSKFAFRH